MTGTENPRPADVPSTASPVVLVFPGPPPQIGDIWCASCATCTDTACGEMGTILDLENMEPWCAHHASQFTGDETVHGPELVALNSDRAHEIFGTSEAVQ